MYGPLNEELMFEEMKNRKAILTRPYREEIAAKAGRRWWRRAVHRDEHRAG
jgi:hypothetical protein